MKRMQDHAVVTDVISYSAAISACEKGYQPRQAIALFEGIQLKALVPNVVSYSAMNSACEKGSAVLCETVQCRAVVGCVFVATDRRCLHQGFVAFCRWTVADRNMFSAQRSCMEVLSV